MLEVRYTRARIHAEFLPWLNRMIGTTQGWGVPAKEVARRAGITSTNFFTKLQRGEGPSAANAEKLASLLSVSEVELRRRTGLDPLIRDGEFLDPSVGADEVEAIRAEIILACDAQLARLGQQKGEG